MRKTFELATPQHVEAMRGRIRQADQDECMAASGVTAEEALLEGIRLTDYPVAALVDGEVVCVFGVRRLTILGATGIPWMLGTDALDRHARELLNLGRYYLGVQMQTFRVLTNWVDARNTRSIRWLRKLGFQVFEPEPYGKAGLPFCRFVMEAKHV